MEIPKVNNVDESKAEEVKAAITLGFIADPLIRWISRPAKVFEKLCGLDG